MAAHDDDFDWVSAQSACTSAQMFQRLLEGARKDVERRSRATFGQDDLWHFEIHVDEDDRFEVARSTKAGKGGAFVAFERNGPRIEIHGDGIDIGLTAIVGINTAGECRYFVGENEYLGWEVRKMALDLLFFESLEE